MTIGAGMVARDHATGSSLPGKFGASTQPAPSNSDKANENRGAGQVARSAPPERKGVHSPARFPYEVHNDAESKVLRPCLSFTGGGEDHGFVPSFFFL